MKLSSLEEFDLATYRPARCSASRCLRWSIRESCGRLHRSTLSRPAAVALTIISLGCSSVIANGPRNSRPRPFAIIPPPCHGLASNSELQTRETVGGLNNNRLSPRIIRYSRAPPRAAARWDPDPRALRYIDSYAI